MSYIRYFMPMISEATGYGFKGRQPAGRSIVESRSHGYKLTVWAQDLRTETFYTTYLLFADAGRYAGIGMGRLPIDEKGKGELRRDFDEDTLCGFALTDIVAVAVLAKDAAGVVSPLCGYKESPVSWRHGFYEHIRTAVAATPAAEDGAMPEPAIPEETPGQQPEETLTLPEQTSPQQPEEVLTLLEEASPQQPDEIASIEETARPEEIPAPSDELILRPEETPSQQPEEAHASPDEAPRHPQEEPTQPQEEWRMPIPQVPESQPVNLQASASQTINPQMPELQTTPLEWHPLHPATPTQGEITESFRMALDQLRADTRGQSAAPVRQTSRLDTIFNTKEPIFPFQNQARETMWVSFTLSDPVPTPANKPHIFDDPFIHSALAEYEHLILGMTVDQGPRRYIIGVPGVYGSESRHKARRLGFTQFKTCDDAHPSWGKLGYWLMFVTV